MQTTLPTLFLSSSGEREMRRKTMFWLLFSPLTILSLPILFFFAANQAYSILLTFAFFYVLVSYALYKRVYKGIKPKYPVVPQTGSPTYTTRQAYRDPSTKTNDFIHGSSRRNSKSRRRHMINMVEANQGQSHYSDYANRVVFCLFCTHKKLYERTPQR
jgi:hypothetical protein